VSGDKVLRAGIEALTKAMFQASYDRVWKALTEYGGHRLARATDALANNRYNCFAYALGIYARPDYQQLVDETAERKNALVDATFVGSLLKRGFITECAFAEMRSGDIALYSDDTKLQHAALVVASDGLCRSKWGPAELYEHGVWEVPSSYGDNLRVVRLASPPDVIMAELVEWIAARN